MPPAQWPQLVLTNDATFRGHSALRGASSFLVRNSSGRIMAATALHLLGEMGGVEPTVPSAGLDSDLASWKMYPRTKPDTFVTVTGLASSKNPRENMDWLLLAIPRGTASLPASPLTLRSTPVQVGEEVFLAGVPYAEPDRAQNIYHGKVTARAFGDRFRFDIDPPVDIRGFSGAPVLDRNGRVVGVMTIWFEPKMQGEKWLEAGGEDAATVFKEAEEHR